MKRIIAVFLMLVMILSLSGTVLAKSGDVAGQYYSTDIHAILNGAEIDSINIGGWTLISAEDMMYYSFSVNWDEYARTLDIFEAPRALNGAPPTIKKSNYPSGNILGNYYETDIVTYLDGHVITAYNIGGRTYIWAEEMRDFGYEVIWNERDRILDIVSPKRAGYEYTIPLTFGEEITKEGTGAFSVSYTKDKIEGSGDANYFNASLSLAGGSYSIDMSFYQNEGLFYSSALMQKLDNFKSSGYGVDGEINPEEKYDIINQSINIIINGYTAENIEVSGGAGNGHRDFYFKINGIPLIKEEEIESVYFSLDEDENAPKYEIYYPEEYYTAEDAILKLLKKNENDFINTSFYTDDYIALSFCESPSLGIIKDRLYLVKTADMSVSADILDEVRKHDGFNYDILNPFAFKVGDIKNNLFFSCRSEQKTGDFYVEMDSGTVHLLAEHDN